MILLTLAVISRAPQSKCRCHERRSGRSEQAKACVFGQMRSLTASYVLPAAAEVEHGVLLSECPAQRAVLETACLLTGSWYRALARSPPYL